MKKNVKSVLVFVPYYVPGYNAGGPIQTIVNMVHFLGDEFDFYIITSDRDYNDKESYLNVKVNGWNQVGKAKVFYASKDNQNVRVIARIIKKIHFDVLYLNSFFHPSFTLKPLLARRLGLLPRCPVIIAPRGEFSEGAYTLKQLKKEVFRWFVTKVGLYRDAIWQASSQFEVEDIKRVMGVHLNKIFIAPNLVFVAETKGVIELSNIEPKDSLKIVFLSRISPKKNLDFALKVLHHVTVAVEFYIYGPRGDSKYWQVCQKLIDAMPKNINVKVMGSIEHSLVVKTLAMYDLFFLPTRGENFGHVIVEALASGTPVLISDATPWRRLDQEGVGWDLPLASKEKFVESIETASLKDATAYLKWRSRVRRYFEENIKNDTVLNANRELFMRAINSNVDVI